MAYGTPKRSDEGKLPKDAAEAIEQAQSYQAAMLPRDSRMDEHMRLWELHDPQLLGNDGAKAKRLLVNDAPAQVEGSTDLMLDTDMTIQVNPPTDSEADRDRAQRAEDLLRHFLAQWEEDHSQRLAQPLQRQAILSLNLPGWITATLRLNPATPQRPTDLRLLNPREVYPDTWDDTPACYVHRYNATRSTLERRWGKKTVADALGDAPSGRPNQDPLECWAFYTTRQMAVAAGKGWLKKPTDHGYPFGNPLICLLASGTPFNGPVFRTTDSTIDSSADWSRYLGTGVLQHQAGAIEDAQDMALMWREVVERLADPVTGYYGPKGEPGLNEVPTAAGGKFTAVYGESDYRQYPPPPQAMQAFGTLAQWNKAQIAQVGLNAMVLGGGNAAAGYDRFLASGAGARPLVPRQRTMELFWTLLMRRALQLFAMLGAELSFQMLNRTTGEFTGMGYIHSEEVYGLEHCVKVTLSRPGPSDKLQTVQMGAQLIDRGVVGPEWILQELNVANPTAEIRKARQARASANPQIEALTTLALIAQRQNAPDDVYGQTESAVCARLLSQQLAQLTLADLQAGAAMRASASPQTPPTPNTGVPNPVQPDELGAAYGGAPNESLPGAPTGGVPQPVPFG